MPNKYHALYLSVISLLLLSLVLSFSFRYSVGPEEESLRRIVVLPFLATDSSPRIVSIRLTKGLIQDLSESTNMVVVPAADTTPTIGEAHSFSDWLKSQEGSLVILGAVSGSEEKLAVSVHVFDTRSKERLLEDVLMTDIYNLAYAREEIVGQVISVANRSIVQ